MANIHAPGKKDTVERKLTQRRKGAKKGELVKVIRLFLLCDFAPLREPSAKPRL